MRVTLTTYEHICDYPRCDQKLRFQEWSAFGTVTYANEKGLEESVSIALRFCSKEHRDEFLAKAK